MKAVISVIGKDMVGILAKVSGECEKANMNVLEVSQTLLQDMFAMIMLVDISKGNVSLAEFAEYMEEKKVVRTTFLGKGCCRFFSCREALQVAVLSFSCLESL